MPEFSPETRNLLSAMLLMAGLLILVAVGIQVVTVYRRRLTARSEDEREMLAESFREAYEAGEIDTDEYRRIRSSLDREPRSAPPPIAPASEHDPLPGPDDGPGHIVPGNGPAGSPAEAPPDAGPPNESRPS